MMCLIDFNEAKQTMKEMKCYMLRLPYIIVQYSIQGDYSSETQTYHMNSKTGTKTFRPTQLSTRNSIKEIIQSEPHLKPRIIQDIF